MSLNELIAQSGKFQAPDLIGQYSTVQQNALNTMKMDEMRRSLSDQEGMRNYLRSNPNLMDPAVQTQMMAYGKAGQEAVATAAKAHQEKASARSSEATANEKDFTQFTRGARTVNNEEGVAQYVASMYSHPTLGEMARSIKPFAQSLKENLELFRKNPLEWQTSASSVPFDKVMELYKGTRQNVDTGGATQGQTVDFRGNVVPGSIMSTPKTMPPGTAEANETARKNVDLRERELNFIQDPVRQAAMAAAKEAAIGEMKADADQASVRAKELKGATDVLNTVEYTIDPKTGIANDRVSDLIRKSTSGPADYARAKLYSLGGGSTKGDIAIGQLGTYSSKLAMDLMGGKLGAGVSNADRDFIVQQLGAVADPLTPSEKRLGAWQEARDRLVKVKKNAEQTSPKAPSATPQGKPANTTAVDAYTAWIAKRGGQ